MAPADIACKHTNFTEQNHLDFGTDTTMSFTLSSLLSPFPIELFHTLNKRFLDALFFINTLVLENSMHTNENYGPLHTEKLRENAKKT